jgi:hypothetical protein
VQALPEILQSADDLAKGAGRWSRAIFWSTVNVVVVFQRFSVKQDYCYKFGEG